MNFLLLSRDGTASIGRSLREAVFHPFGEMRLDRHHRCVVFRDQRDTISFDRSYNDEDFVREATRRGLAILRRNGYTLFTRQDD